MTREEFDLCITHLKHAYGESKYPEIRCDLFFSRFSVLDYQTFESGIKSIIAKEDKAPMVERIASELRAELIEAWKKYAEKLRGESNCNSCKNSGYVIHRASPGFADVVTKCRCVLGKLWPSYRPFPPSKVQHIDRATRIE